MFCAISAKPSGCCYKTKKADPPFFQWITRKDDYQYVVIEEPEMGLHPKAIQAVILQVLELLSLGYQVVISTHSPLFLEFAWAFRLLQESRAPEKALADLFDLKSYGSSRQLFQGIREKNIRTYFFSREQEEVRSKDISSMDAGSEDLDIAEWGGISSFAGKAGDIVSRYIQDPD